MNLNDISAHWVALHETLGLGAAIRDAAHYAQLLEVAEQLMDSMEDRADHPLNGLLDLLADRIKAYEQVHYPWPDTTTPASRLAFLMEQHGLTQSDLPEVGAQSVVSAVLAGKRQINLRQAKALAGRFGLPIEAFVA